MKPPDAKPSTYIDFNIINKTIRKILNLIILVPFNNEVNNPVRISKYKNIFAKVYTLTWSEDFCCLKKVKNAVSWI